ncbi:MAG: class I SAM-dependent methyltransferase [Leptospirales bacterium]|nr:class I SAM-dependent methyltransferase [Leptospirales bacterium]
MDLIGMLEQRGLEVSSALSTALDWKALALYYQFLEENNERGGFFSRNDSTRILDRHLFECAVSAFHALDRCPQYGIVVSRETRVLDAGAGPGLPGMAFAAHRLRPAVTLVDSSRRRLSLLEDWLQTTDTFSNVRTCYARVEELKGTFDLALVRALLPFPASLELLCRVVRIGGAAIVFHGLAPTDPRRHAYLKKLGFVSCETIVLPELQSLGQRNLGIYLKEAPASRGYPRTWRQIKDSVRKW